MINEIYCSKPITAKINTNIDNYLNDLFLFINDNHEKVCENIKYSPSLFDSQKESLYEKKMYLLSQELIDENTDVSSEEKMNKFFNKDVKKSLLSKIELEVDVDTKDKVKAYEVCSKKKLLSYMEKETSFYKLCSSHPYLWKKIIKLCFYQKYTKVCLKELFELFSKADFYEVLNKDNPIEEIELIDTTILNEIFYYFYEKLLKSKKFQEYYCESQDIKKIYRDDVKKGRYCPTCGLAQFYSSGDVDIDHFLPKSKFPFLSIYSENLLGVCKSCNQIFKHEKIQFPIAHPRKIEIAKKINMNYSLENDENNHKVIFTVDEGDEDYCDGLKNYIELFQLKERYNDELFLDEIQGDIIEKIMSIEEYPTNDDDLKKTAKFILNHLEVPKYKANKWKIKILISFFFMASEDIKTFGDFKKLVRKSGRMSR